MNKLIGSPLVNRVLFQGDLLPCFTQSVRNKAKKAQSSKRNNNQAKGQHYRLRFQDGANVKKYWSLGTQNRLRYHGGLNVGVCGKFTLIALAEGKLMITCEKPDVYWAHSWNKLFYSGREGVTFYKKYLHVIPNNPHNRFKVITQI